jgi:anaerobic selenocysteine-containing dehydrogenase
VPLLREAQRNSVSVVAIDPRRAVTGRSADLRIAPRPATDRALALGLMNVLCSEHLHGEAWPETNTIGWRERRDRAAEYPVERSAATSGLSVETIVDLPRRYGTTKSAPLKFAGGVQRHGNVGQTARVLSCLLSSASSACAVAAFSAA